MLNHSFNHPKTMRLSPLGQQSHFQAQDIIRNKNTTEI